MAVPASVIQFILEQKTTNKTFKYEDGCGNNALRQVLKVKCLFEDKKVPKAVGEANSFETRTIDKVKKLVDSNGKIVLCSEQVKSCDAELCTRIIKFQTECKTSTEWGKCIM
jgi:hypothetical protein